MFCQFFGSDFVSFLDRHLLDRHLLLHHLPSKAPRPTSAPPDSCVSPEGASCCAAAVDLEGAVLTRPISSVRRRCPARETSRTRGRPATLSNGRTPTPPRAPAAGKVSSGTPLTRPSPCPPPNGTSTERRADRGFRRGRSPFPSPPLPPRHPPELHPRSPELSGPGGSSGLGQCGGMIPARGYGPHPTICASHPLAGYSPPFNSGLPPPVNEGSAPGVRLEVES